MVCMVLLFVRKSTCEEECEQLHGSESWVYKEYIRGKKLHIFTQLAAGNSSHNTDVPRF